MWSLPQIFFRKDNRKNTLMWWVTASPYGLAPTFMVLGQRGILTPLVDPVSNIGRILEVASVPFAAASIALQFATMSVHRVPLALWHQPDDAPKSIVTWGPYGRVRHPFYVSFLLLMIGTVIVFPHPSTIGIFVLSLILLSVTASREERRLLQSEFGSEYAEYLKQTGRFIPRLSVGR
jgi:protein-S-isoprenylcysteine O-methyltransferase Ste14